MKITPTCVPCLLNRIIFEAKQSTENEKIQTQVIKNACSMLGRLYDPNECSAVIATQVHRKTYDILNNQDPYDTLKAQSNQIASSLVPIVKKRISKSVNPLKTAFLVSIVGNTLDFGIAGASSSPYELQLVFDEIFNEGIAYDDFEKVYSLLKKSSSILYFTDNSGEIVFDRIVCEQLQKTFPNLSINLVVKGEPVLSDATMNDVKNLSFQDVVDNIFTTGGYAVGVNFSLLPIEVKEKLKQVDLALCKGMANYESFSETKIHPIVYLLRTKCQPIASSMKVPVHANIIKLYE
jgi:damage-control phosphatase, subfamily I